MKRTFGVIGVPSSAGAHWPGQEKAPAVLRAVGLIEQLAAQAVDAVDYGDLPLTRWQLDPQEQHPHSLTTVLAVAQSLAERVTNVVRAGQVPLVLGGDCSIEIGMVSGMLHHQDDVALLYFDGGCDLRTPLDEPSGILDSMGVAHMIGSPGTAASLREIGPRVPLMPQEKIVFFAYTPNLSPEEREEVLDQYAMPRYSAAQVRAGPEALAGEVRTRLESMAQQFIVHFDVDVIDFMMLPLPMSHK